MNTETGETFQGQCEYCDRETEVIHFAHIALNACEDCYRVHKQAIDSAEQHAGRGL